MTHLPYCRPVAAAAKSLQSCPTLCDPIDGSPPGSPIPGILQARTLEWVAISFSNAWKWKVKVKSLSRVRLLATPWTAAYQAPPSMGFSRQEYWSGLPLPSPVHNTNDSQLFISAYLTLIRLNVCVCVYFNWLTEFEHMKHTRLFSLPASSRNSYQFFKVHSQILKIKANTIFLYSWQSYAD